MYTNKDIKAMGLSNLKLAALAGRTPSQVSRWTKGREPWPAYAITIIKLYLIAPEGEREQLLTELMAAQSLAQDADG